MSKKSKKYTGRRIGFGGIFIRRLPAAIAAAAVLCLIAVNVMSVILQNGYRDMHQYTKNAALNSMQRALELYKGVRSEDRMLGIAYMHSSDQADRTDFLGFMRTDLVIEVDDAEDNTLLVTAPVCQLRIDHEAGVAPEYFYCPTDYFEDMEKDLELHGKEKDRMAYVDIDLLTAYIDRENKTFLPGEIKAEIGGEEKGQEQYVPFFEKKYDLTPSDTGNAELVKQGENDELHCFRVGCPENSRAYSGLKKDIDYGINHEFEDSGNYYIKTGSGAVISSPEGRVYKVYFAFYSDYSIELMYFSRIICGIIIGVLLIVMLLSSWRTSMVYKSHYAMEDYRREMTNTMAHDLKSPLMAISGCAEILSGDVPAEKAKRYAGVILSNVEYMNEIISNVLELAKLEGGRKPVPEELEPVELAGELMEKYSVELSGRGIESSVTGSGSVRADRQMLSQALDNLISNAVKYTADGGRIEISADKKGITISNDSSEDTNVSDEELWKPFVKGDSARSSEKGSGIGLSIVRSVCDAHGFSASLSRSDGKFIVRIDY